MWRLSAKIFDVLGWPGVWRASDLLCKPQLRSENYFSDLPFGNNLCAANHDFTPKEAYRVERKLTGRSEDHGPFFTSLLPPHVSNHDLHNNQI